MTKALDKLKEYAKQLTLTTPIDTLSREVLLAMVELSDRIEAIEKPQCEGRCIYCFYTVTGSKEEIEALMDNHIMLQHKPTATPTDHTDCYTRWGHVKRTATPSNATHDLSHAIEVLKNLETKMYFLAEFPCLNVKDRLTINAAIDVLERAQKAGKQ